MILLRCIYICESIQLTKMDEHRAPRTAVTFSRHHVPLLRFLSVSMLLVALDSLVCIALWLAGGDSLYLEDSVTEFSFTHSTFDLVVIATVRGVILVGCFYLLDRSGNLTTSSKNGDRKSSTDRFVLMCQLSTGILLIFSGVSLIYAVVKGGIIIHSIVNGTWGDVSKEIEMHITYKILCITAVAFPLLEFALGLIGLWFVRKFIRVQRLRLLVNLEGDGDVESQPEPRKKADIKRIILTAKPVSV